MNLAGFPAVPPFSLNKVLHKFEGPVGTPKHALRIQILAILESPGPKELETVPSDVDFKLFFPYVVTLRHPNIITIYRGDWIFFNNFRSTYVCTSRYVLPKA